jgi:hypothetical protein
METNFVKVRETYKNKGEINNDQRFKIPQWPTNLKLKFYVHVYVGDICQIRGQLLKFRGENLSTIEMIPVNFL